jgi:hypothetical protein
MAKKVAKIEHISVNNGTTLKYFRSSLLSKMGLIKPKNHLTLLSLGIASWYLRTLTKLNFN